MRLAEWPMGAALSRFGCIYTGVVPTAAPDVGYDGGVKTTTTTTGGNTMTNRDRNYSPILEGASRAWECYLVRVAILAAALGAVPFYFLSLAVASLGGN